MQHFDADEVQAMRAQYPGHWVCEVIVPGAAALIAIPATEENASRPIPGAEMFVGADLDGLSLRPLKARREAP